MPRLLNQITKFFCSMRLTVACLCLGLLLVFFGTLAQVDLGLYKAQNDYFRSFFIYWGPKGASWHIPVFPGGYLVGAVLLTNLVSAHIQRFRFEKKKIGILMIHFGLIMMLLGQLLTDLLASESSMRIKIGETKNYSESDRQVELAVVDVTEPDKDLVVAIPESILQKDKEVRHPELPFVVQIQKFYPNSTISAKEEKGFIKAGATVGPGAQYYVREEPKVTTMNRRDLPSALVELVTPSGSLGTMLVGLVLEPQTINLGKRTLQLAIRGKRFYKPFSLHLDNFNHGKYKGTDIAMDFSSMVHLRRPDTGEDRVVRIYMNNPLRYAGETFYQASFEPDDSGTVLQVVHNPSWLTPYLSCALVGLGMVVQFGMHLIGFIRKRVMVPAKGEKSKPLLTELQKKAI